MINIFEKGDLISDEIYKEIGYEVLSKVRGNIVKFTLLDEDLYDKVHLDYEISSLDVSKVVKDLIKLYEKEVVVGGGK